MNKYPLVAIVDRVVSDTISLTVEAEDEGEAYEKARKMLEVYPEPHSVKGVSYCFVDYRQYVNNDVITIRPAHEELGIG